MAIDVRLSPDFQTAIAIVAPPDTKLELVLNNERCEILYLYAMENFKKDFAFAPRGLFFVARRAS